MAIGDKEDRDMIMLEHDQLIFRFLGFHDDGMDYPDLVRVKCSEGSRHGN